MCLVGAAQSAFGSFPDESYRSLFARAFERALDSVDGDLDRTEFDEAYVGSLGVGGRQLGLSAPAVTKHVGLDGTASTRIENACVECNAVGTPDPVEPAGTGEVVAQTVIESGAPPEFAALVDAQGAIGVVLVDLDEGVRVPGMLTDCDPHEVERGDRVERVVRRIYEQEGIPRYGAKFRPEA